MQREIKKHKRTRKEMEKDGKGERLNRNKIIRGQVYW